ncbi:MAG TPA: hypothetical protein VGM72_10070 [Micropepsaceae bacterium]
MNATTTVSGKQDSLRQSTSAASKMTVLGLDSIRARTGDQWKKRSEKVHSYFTMLFQREMRPGDTFHRVDELSYLVIFRELSVADAQAKCLAIADTVSRRLFGEDTGAVSIRSVIGAVSNRLLTEDVEEQAAIQAFLEAEGTEIITTSEGPEILERTVDTRIEPPKELSAPPLPPAQHLNVTFGPDHDGSQALLENEFAFKYRPFWDAARKVVLMYVCQPAPAAPPKDASPHSFAYGLCVSPERNESSRLDLLVLEEAAQRVEFLRRSGYRILAACPVHFSTIAGARSWGEYLRALTRLRADVVRDIVFLIMGIDGSIPGIRLVQEIPKLSARTKLVFAAIKYGPGVVRRFANTGIHAIGVELPRPEGSDRPLLTAVDALARDAQALGIESFVLGARNRSTIVGAIASGVRYLEGLAVSPPVFEPRHAFAQEIADLYR